MNKFKNKNNHHFILTDTEFGVEQHHKMFLKNYILSIQSLLSFIIHTRIRSQLSLKVYATLLFYRWLVLNLDGLYETFREIQITKN